MDLSLYRETELEHWISIRYQQHGILTANDLEIEHVAEAFGIDIVIYQGKPFSCNISNVIFLPHCIDKETQRLIFFHELCHVLRHAGDQTQMHELFHQQQEMEAERFLAYAAAPFFMIAAIDLEESLKDAVEQISSEFHLPHTIAHARLIQIQNRILHHILWMDDFQRNLVSKTLTLSEATQSLLQKLHTQLNKE
ncbi:ImmA/IrrE family metallo-endopeptidase [Paenibacillus shirakamiensis]|nr:ImmA/IrrE family metallo-endopeptidase [Paenibacillus shirakamiensis]